MTSGSQLVMREGPQPGQTFILDRDSLVVGRDPSSDIVISDPQVSRQHARIRYQGGLTVIEDMGSTNGTFVNGMQLTSPHTLTNGDMISLGDAVTLTYHAEEIATTEPLGGRPTALATPPSYEPPPAPPQVYPAEPALTYPAEPAPPYPAEPAPTYQAAPPYSAAQPAAETSRTTWLWVGCISLVLLAIVACVAVFVLDYLELLPAFFYEPLRWLGLI